MILFGIFQVLNRILKHTSKFYGFKPSAALCAINLFTFLLNWRTFQSHPKNNLMFTKFLQLEVLGIHIIILFLYKSKTYLRVHLEKTFIFTVFKRSECLWEQFLLLLCQTNNLLKNPVKFYSFLASVVQCVQNRFTFLLA